MNTKMKLTELPSEIKLYVTNGQCVPLLSICVPTFNRGRYLENCLESIRKSLGTADSRVEICISDNASSDNTSEIVELASRSLNINYRRNPKNMGMAQNFLDVVSMAKGKYVWLVGDDDLLMPNGIDKLLKLINDYPEIDFFYVNAYHLNSFYLENYPHPFDTDLLPKVMEKFSKAPLSRALDFFELVSPNVSFDFLGGIFLSVFRREKWMQSIHVLDVDAVASPVIFSHFDNTFPHIKIWADAFRSSRAFLNTDPLIVCINGIREWAPMTPMIMGVRLPEALRVYRASGMGWWRYIYSMNYAFRNFGSNITNMLLHRKVYKFPLPFAKIIISSLPYPNTYLSIIYFIVRRLRNILWARPPL
jgi:glycosyltransferase involved in cell wall biosynthesis